MNLFVVEMKWLAFRRWLAANAYWLLSPDGDGRAEIRPNRGKTLTDYGRCEDTDEVVGFGFLHVEQMDKNQFWARLYTPKGDDIVMWFNSKSPIKLTAEPD